MLQCVLLMQNLVKVKFSGIADKCKQGNSKHDLEAMVVKANLSDTVHILEFHSMYPYLHIYANFSDE